MKQQSIWLPTSIFILITLSCLLHNTACQKPQTPIEPDPEPQPTWVADTTLIPQIIAQVDSNRIRNTIQTLQDFGTRYSYHPKCYEAAQWIKAELESYGYNVEFQTYFPNVHRFYDIEFVSKNVGCIVGEGSVILMTQDAGISWMLRDVGSYLFFDRTYFLDEDNGWVWNDDWFNTFYTKDGGETWNEIASPLFYETPGAIYFQNEQKGWIGSVYGKLFYTEDGGNNWIRHGLSFRHIREIYFVNDTLGWISDSDNIYKTEDGGSTWTAMGFDRKVTKIRFIKELSGMMIGEYGRLKITQDGGNEWTETLGQQQISDFDFITEDKIIAVGQGYFLSEDGGTNWQEYPSEHRHTNVDFMNQNKGFMTGHESAILRSMDGANTWCEVREGLPPEIFLHNIKAVKQGKISSDSKFIIGAHYDSYNKEMGVGVGAPGANDNASGTAGVLEIARLLKDYDFDYTVEFILFSGEEVGLLGSKYAASNSFKMGEDIAGMINLDMIGYCPEGNSYDFNIMSLDVDFRSSFVRGASLYSDITYYEIDDNGWDDKAYYTYGYPALTIFEDDTDPSNHYAWDTVEKLNLDYASEIIRFTMGGLMHFVRPVFKD